MSSNWDRSGPDARRRARHAGATRQDVRIQLHSCPAMSARPFSALLLLSSVAFCAANRPWRTRVVADARWPRLHVTAIAKKSECLDLGAGPAAELCE